MTIDRDEDLEGLKRVAAAVARTRDEVARHVAPGISTAALDEAGRAVLARLGARPAPTLAYGFPGALCISVNDALAHGIPSRERRLREGDLVNIDVSAELDGYWADCGASYPVGRVSPRARTLLIATEAAQREAMQEARAGRPLRALARAVEKRAKRHGLGVVRELGGHGVGRHIHEDPHVANVVSHAGDEVLWEGLVMTIEPFLTTRATRVVQDRDGWTLRTPDGSIGAQFEHTLVVTRGAPIVLTERAA